MAGEGWSQNSTCGLSGYKALNCRKNDILKVKVKSLSLVHLFATPLTVAHQAPPFMGFSRQEYWSGLPFPSPGDLPNPGIKPRSPALEADALTSEQLVKNPPPMQETPVQFLDWEDPLEKD